MSIRKAHLQHPLPFSAPGSGRVVCLKCCRTAPRCVALLCTSARILRRFFCHRQRSSNSPFGYTAVSLVLLLFLAKQKAHRLMCFSFWLLKLGSNHSVWRLSRPVRCRSHCSCACTKLPSLFLPLAAVG